MKCAVAAVWRRIAPRLEDWPQYLLLPASAWYTHLDPRFQPATLYQSSPWLCLAVDGRVLIFPDLTNNAESLKHGSVAKAARGYFEEDPMLDRYFLPDGFAIDEGDTVVDVGAYVGTFAARAASEGAGAVYALEPDDANRRCCAENTKRYDAVTVLSTAAWSQTTAGTIEAGQDSADARVRADGAGGVELQRLEDFLDENGVGAVDFLKIDAEGRELHVVRGLGDADVRRIAADCGEGGDPERVAETLRVRGYRVDRVGHMVFGSSPGVSEA